MLRSGKIILLSHCLLNANSKINGSAKFGTVFKPVLEYIIKHDVGMVQLPCPEHSFYGCARPGQSKEHYDNPIYRNHCCKILQPVLEQLADFAGHGYVLLGVLGIKGSPSCGVEHTCRKLNSSSPGNKLAAGTGVFMEIFRLMLTETALPLDFYEVDEKEPDETLQRLEILLKDIKEGFNYPVCRIE